LLRAHDASSPNLSTNKGKETPDDVPESFHVAGQVWEVIGAAVNAGDMEVFSVSYVNGFIAKQLLCGVDCAACKACLSSKVLISISVIVL
jgi:hypothetical protein